MNQNQQKENHFLGILGALLGAIVGALPMIIVSFIGLLTGWLGIFTALGSFYGYKLLNGPRQVGFAKGTIITCTILVSLGWSVLIGVLLAFSGDFDATNVTIFIIPFFAGFIGYGFVHKKLQLYIDPHIVSRAVDRANYEIHNSTQNHNKYIYLPDSKRLRPLTVTTTLVCLIPIAIIFITILLGAATENESLLIATLIGVFVFSISCLCTVPFIKYNKERVTCFVASGNRLFKINLQTLNSHQSYQFCIVSPLLAFSIDRLSDQEKHLMVASAFRIVSDYETGNVAHLAYADKDMMVEMRNMQLVSENATYYKVTYFNNSNIMTHYKIMKIYPGFLPFRTNTDPNKSIPINWVVLSIVVCSTLLSIAIAYSIMSITTPYDDYRPTSSSYSPNYDNYSSSSSSSNSSSSSSISAGVPYVKGELVDYEMGSISFQVPNNHPELIEGMFLDPQTDEIYGVIDISTMGSDTPDNTFDMLVEYYSTIFVLKDSSDYVLQWFTDEGVSVLTGDVTVLDDDGLENYLKVILVPDKNLVVTTTSQSKEITENIDTIVESLVFHIGDDDYVSGNVFVNTTDQTEVHFNDYGQHYLYTEIGNYDSEFYRGNYDVYYGEDALTFLENNPQENLTRAMAEEIIKNSADGYFLNATTINIEDYMLYDDDGNVMGVSDDLEVYSVSKDTCYILHIANSTVTVDGIEMFTPSTEHFVYFGFYIPEINGMELIYLDTFEQSVWENMGPVLAD